MGKPYKSVSPIDTAMMNIISAESSLNMMPQPIESKSGTKYLSETDANAAHSVEHIQVAREAISLIQANIDTIRFNCELAKATGDDRYLDKVLELLKGMVIA